MNKNKKQSVEAKPCKRTWIELGDQSRWAQKLFERIRDLDHDFESGCCAAIGDECTCELDKAQERLVHDLCRLDDAITAKRIEQAREHERAVTLLAAEFTVAAVLAEINPFADKDDFAEEVQRRLQLEREGKPILYGTKEHPFGSAEETE